MVAAVAAVLVVQTGTAQMAAIAVVLLAAAAGVTVAAMQALLVPEAMAVSVVLAATIMQTLAAEQFKQRVPQVVVVVAQADHQMVLPQGMVALVKNGIQLMDQVAVAADHTLA